MATPETALAYLELAAKFFAGRGIATARLDAELLLAQVLATDRVGVYLRFDRPLGRAEVDTYRAIRIAAAYGCLRLLERPPFSPRRW